MLFGCCHARVRMALFVIGVVLSSAAIADEAAIRKNLPERLPNFPTIDEVSQTVIPGINAGDSLT